MEAKNLRSLLIFILLIAPSNLRAMEPGPLAQKITGHAAVLQFWATWCSSCGTVFHDIEKALAEAPSVRYLSINTDKDTSKAQTYLDNHALRKFLRSRTIFDAEGKFSQQFDITTLPTLLLIDNKGRELRRIEGHYTNPQWHGFRSELSNLHLRAQS